MQSLRVCQSRTRFPSSREGALTAASSHPAQRRPVTRVVRCLALDDRNGKTQLVQHRLFPKALGLGLVGAASVLLLTAGQADASKSEKVGEWAASGFLFKDSVEVIALDDPDVAGVTLYISDFKRSLADKLTKNFFSEPSTTSLTCAITGPVVFKDGVEKSSKEGREVFEESKGLNFFIDKTQRVRRVFDAKRQTLVYVAYSTRLTSASDDKGVTSGRYKTSVCVVALPAAPSVSVAP